MYIIRVENSYLLKYMSTFFVFLHAQLIYWTLGICISPEGATCEWGLQSPHTPHHPHQTFGTNAMSFLVMGPLSGGLDDGWFVCTLEQSAECSAQLYSTYMILEYRSLQGYVSTIQGWFSHPTCWIMKIEYLIFYRYSLLLTLRICHGSQTLWMPER